MARASSKLIEGLGIAFEIIGTREMSPRALQDFAQELAAYPEPAVMSALSRCKREVKGHLTLADVISRIEDGRPGAEEAWAMVPKDEFSSVVWTDEMRGAFGTVRHLIEEDPIAARMAFREVYLKLITEARAARQPARWEPSLGLNPSTHAPALKEAQAKGRMTAEHVATLLPEHPRPALRLSLPSIETQELSPIDTQALLSNLREQLKQVGDA